jgi:hypothetical protein
LQGSQILFDVGAFARPDIPLAISGCFEYLYARQIEVTASCNRLTVEFARRDCKSPSGAFKVRLCELEHRVLAGDRFACQLGRTRPRTIAISFEVPRKESEVSIRELVQPFGSGI